MYRIGGLMVFVKSHIFKMGGGGTAKGFPASFAQHF